MRTIDTFYFGEVTLRDCFDPDTSMNDEGFVEVTDSNGNVIADIYGYNIDDINHNTAHSGDYGPLLCIL